MSLYPIDGARREPVGDARREQPVEVPDEVRCRGFDPDEVRCRGFDPDEVRCRGFDEHLNDEESAPISVGATTLPPRAPVVETADIAAQAADTAAAETSAPKSSRRNLLLGLGAVVAAGCATRWLRGGSRVARASTLAPALPPLPRATDPSRQPVPTALPWPARRADAPKGRAFGKQLRELLVGKQREMAILDQLTAGNVPDFMRTLVPVVLEQGASAAEASVLYVLPDYVAIGTDDDFLRIPMMPATAQLCADAVGCGLPTRAMVDAIYKAAEVKLTPTPLDSGPEMITSDEFVRHQHEIEVQRQARSGVLGALTAGHKKDIVQSAKLVIRRRRVAIYGMHKRDGSPIQLLSTLHQYNYVDYAHGVRLVGPEMLVAGRRRKVSAVLGDPALASLLSDEGPLPQIRYPRRF